MKLLPNGNIGCLRHMHDAELDIYADAPMQVPPDDPDYENLIPFLPPDQVEQRREELQGTLLRIAP